MRKKFLKRMLSILMVVVMTFAIAPLSTLASDNTNLSETESEIIHGTEGLLDYEIQNGEVTITACDTSVSDDIIIPSTLVGYPVTSIGDYAFNSCYNLTSVTFREDCQLTSIGYAAFAYCYSLTSITIPDTVTSIGEGAFALCINLKSVTVGNNVKVIRPEAFMFTSLKSIEIPASVKEIGHEEELGCWGVFFTTNTIKKITVDENNSSYSSDENGVLFNKDKTKLLLYPNGKPETTYIVSDSVNTIGFYAFCDLTNEFDSSQIHDICASFEQETGIKYTGELNLNTVEEVYIGKKVKTIEEYAFYYSDVTDIYYAGSEEEWNEINIQDYAIPETITIHYNTLPCKHVHKTFIKYTSHPEHYAIYKCIDCDREITDTVVNTLEEWKVITEPTYEKEGVKTLYCAICGEVIKTEPISMLPPKVLGMELDKENISINRDDTVQLISEIEMGGEPEYKVTYLSSNEKVAVVDENGNVTGKMKGNTVITCTVTDADGHTFTDTCDVTVNFTFVHWLLYIICFGWIWM